MGKKIDKLTPASASAGSPESKATETLAEPPPANGNGSAKKKPATAVKKKAPAKKPATFSMEDIALRAYYIAEHRHRHGIHGDSHSDWIEAERQLKAEQKKTSKKVSTSKKRP